MHAILAQETAEPAQNPVVNLFETVIQVFSRADTLAQPQQLVDALGALSVVWAVVFLIVGLTCLFNGYRYHKIVTVALALLLGAFAGYWMGQKVQAPFIIAGCMGLLLAVLSLPLMKYAVAVFGGLTGAFVGANLWAGFADALNRGWQMGVPTDTYWVGALMGLMMCGMLAFVLYKLSVVMFTSISGATIAVFGAIALLLSFNGWKPTVVEGLTANQIVVPMLVFVPALIGLILQHGWAGGQKTAAEGDEE